MHKLAILLCAASSCSRLDAESQSAAIYTAPVIISTTLNAPIVDGAYQLYAGRGYQATVVVTAGSVTYHVLVEPHAVSPSLSVTATQATDVYINAYSGNHSFVFNVTSNVSGGYQLAFDLKDRGTGNVYDVDGGVALWVNGSMPRISSTTLPGASLVNGSYRLDVGRRYDVIVRVVPGSVSYNAGVQSNQPDGSKVPGLNLHNLRMPWILIDQSRNSWDFHLNVTPTQAGTYTVDFEMWDAGTNPDPNHAVPFGPAPSITLVASVATAGLSGNVTAAFTGAPISGVTVYPNLGSSTVTDGSGYFHLPAGATALTFVKSGYSTTVALHLQTAGMHVDADMETAFNLGSSAYTRYLDYAEGRTLFHVVSFPHRTATLEVVEGAQAGNPFGYEDGVHAADRLSAAALINGGFFNYGDGNALGYAYYQGQRDCEPFTPDPKNPPPPPPSPQPQMTVLGISGTGVNQFIRLENKDAYYLQAPYGDPLENWAPNGPGQVLWDDNLDGASDVDWALQMPWLVNGSDLIGDTDSLFDDSDRFWARTAVGITSAGDVFLAVADGDGLLAASGSSIHRIALLLHDELSCTSAIQMDGGGSTKMVLRKSDGSHHLVTTPTSENPRSVAYSDTAVRNFIVTW